MVIAEIGIWDDKGELDKKYVRCTTCDMWISTGPVFEGNCVVIKKNFNQHKQSKFHIKAGTIRVGRGEATIPHVKHTWYEEGGDLFDDVEHGQLDNYIDLMYDFKKMVKKFYKKQKEDAWEMGYTFPEYCDIYKSAPFISFSNWYFDEKGFKIKKKTDKGGKKKKRYILVVKN